MLVFPRPGQEQEVGVGQIGLALPTGPKATSCELEQNTLFLKTLIAIFQKTLMTPNVDYDFSM